MIPQKSFYMVRHGESQANAQEILAGQTQTPLTPHGIKQAQNERVIFDALSPKPSIVIHSHLPRAKDTAEILNTNLNLPMLENQNIQEQDFGDWENVPYSKCLDDLKNGINPPNGENRENFNDRIQKSISSILNNHEHPILVCHGGVFHSFYRLYNKENFWIQNARIYRFKPRDQKPFPWDVSIVGDE